MKNLIRNLIVVLLLGFVSVVATSSTYIWIPGADFQPFLSPHFGWDTYINTQGSGVTTNGGLTMGVLPFKKVQMEVGVDYRDINGNHVYPFLFNAKLGFPEDAFFKNQPAIEGGMYDVGFVKNVNSYNIAYGLLAKNIWKLGRFTLGGYKGAVGASYDTLFDTGNKGEAGWNKDKGIIAGWDRMMPEISDKLWLCVDFQSGLSSYGALSFGFSWYFTSNISVLCGYDYYLDNSAIKPTATVQLDINLR